MTNVRGLRISGARVRAWRRELGLSLREFAEYVGTRERVIGRIEREEPDDHVRKDLLVALADAFGVGVEGLLVADDSPEPSGGELADAARVHAVLMRGRRTRPTRIAEDLGSPLARVQAAGRVLAAQLDGLGARLVDAQGWTIRPADQLLRAAQQQAVTRSDYHDRSLTVGEAQLLKRVPAGGVQVRYLRTADEMAAGRMTNAGFIEERGGMLHPTSWLTYNLGLTNRRPQPRQPLGWPKPQSGALTAPRGRAPGTALGIGSA